jgi:hypothetical protein
MNGGHFSKWPPATIAFAHSLACETDRNLLFMSMPILPGSRNPIRAILTILTELVMIFSFNISKWPPKNTFLPIS